MKAQQVLNTIWAVPKVSPLPSIAKKVFNALWKAHKATGLCFIAKVKRTNLKTNGGPSPLSNYATVSEKLFGGSVPLKKMIICTNTQQCFVRKCRFEIKAVEKVQNSYCLGLQINFTKRAL
jgi:hypothetical protein